MKISVYNGIRNAKAPYSPIGVDRILKESSFAVLVEISSGKIVWLPKSVISVFKKESGSFIVEIPTWLYEAKLNE